MVGFTILNPRTWVPKKTKGVPEPPVDPNAGSAPVPIPEQLPAPVGSDPEPTIVTGRFVENGGPQSASELYTESTKQTERFLHLVEKFDEDRQEPVEWVIRRGASLFCYVAPFVLAVPIGLAIGDVFTPAKATGAMPLAIHLLSIFLEMMMPILGLAASISFKRAVKDRSKMAGAVWVAVLFGLVSLGNGLALLFLLEKGGVGTGDAATWVGIVGRSFGSFIIDIGATVYLTVSGMKSLAKYLADQRAKIVAVRDVNTVHIEMEQTQIKAAIDRQTAIMEMGSKQQRASTWNEIEKMQSQAMIEQAKRNMNGGSDGSRRASW